jgi:hypothetical protein
MSNYWTIDDSGNFLLIDGGGGKFLLVSIIEKAVDGTLSFIGVKSTAVSKTISGLIQYNGVISKFTSIVSTVGSLTPAGLLDAYRSVVLKSLEGFVSFTGVIAKKTYHSSFNGVLNYSGTVKRAIYRSLTGALSPQGLVSKRTYLNALSGSIGFVGLIAKIAAKIVAGVFSGSGIIGRLVSIVKSGSLSTTGILSAFKSPTQPSGHEAYFDIYRKGRKRNKR